MEIQEVKWTFKYWVGLVSYSRLILFSRYKILITIELPYMFIHIYYIHTLLCLFCQTVRKAVFPLHSYVIHRTKTATRQLRSSPLPIFSFPFHHFLTSVSHSSGKTADRCGRRWSRWQGWQQKLFRKKMKIRRCEEKDESSTHSGTHFALVLLYLQAWQLVT